MSDDNRKIAIEEVDHVEPPRRARVEDAFVETPPIETPTEKLERKRDYLAGFLSEAPRADNPAQPGGDIYDAVIDALKEIYDPEIPVNIYDLGLIYNVEVGDAGHVVVTMTLTTPHCPVAESMPGEVELRVGSVPGVGLVDVNLVWDPPWSPEHMSDEARLELGML
jgi:FeS assembly SUF system protein